ncbi:MAG TPA: arginine--tRNA ligase [Gammaproteobacteria bacterium]|nr:arginine--tRNA ligase [Gammaproteobacteria bacterium]
MKKQLQELINQSLQTLKSEGLEITIQKDDIKIEYSRDASHGDFATNIAMVLAKTLNCNPRELANKITKNIPKINLVKNVEIAGPGFINFFLSQNSYQSVVLDILKHGDLYGNSEIGENKPTLVEFVSANPTGPLHIGHGRGAACGAAICNLLRKTGFDVYCEYYVNDSGRQVNILTVSVWLRYLQQFEEKIIFPDNAYQGNYITDIAVSLKKKYGDKFIAPNVDILNIITKKEDEDAKIDKLINHCKNVLGEKKYHTIFEMSLASIQSSIEEDLCNFGIEFNNWFSEYSLIKNNMVEKCISKLDKNSWVYEKNGAKWFRSSKLGDEKDRVLVKENGQTTYFASDIAYHMSKFERGYKKIINIWGADHHGYIARIVASVKALDYPPEAIKVLLVQFAALFRGKEKLQMSTRSGEFITLKELVKEVGKDAARFFYIQRKNEQHLDFDLELAKSESNDNPVYYIQYAHARICSVFRQMNEKGYSFIKSEELSDLSVLSDPHEIKLLTSLARYPDVIENSAISFEPHQLAYYLKELANDFHTYYNASKFLVDDNLIRNARLSLILSTKQVIKDGLSLLGVSSPEEM